MSMDATTLSYEKLALFLQSSVTLQPIGIMKSVFHLKNGTPRQSSLCEGARGVVTIDKSIFNNPEHSLEGLEQFSHAW